MQENPIRLGDGEGHPAPAEPCDPERTRQALGEDLARLRPRMTSVARRFTTSGWAADDIVQNAYEKVVRNLDQFRGQSRFSTWLHRIVVNEALMWLRAEKRWTRGRIDIDIWSDIQLPNADDVPDAAERLTGSQRAERVRICLEALPAAERDVLLHCGLGEMTYGQFSAENGIHAGAAKSRAYRGRQRLRAMLGEP